MDQTFRRATPDQLRRLQQNADGLVDFLYGDFEALEAGAMQEAQENGQVFDMGKEWMAIHFLLTGESTFGPSELNTPLSRIVYSPRILDGDPEEGEVTYYLTPSEVQESAQALQQLPREEVAGRYDLKVFNDPANMIYPIHYGFGEWSADDINGLMDVFGRLVVFFDGAARNDDAIIVWTV